MMFRKILLLAVVIAALGARSSPAQTAISEQSVVEVLPLVGPIAHPEAEISGLAWWKDQLLILPQFPHRFGDKRYGKLYALPRADILEVLDGRSRQPLSPRPIRFVDHGLRQQLEHFEGYEALAVQGSRVFLTVESSPHNVMHGFVVSGRLARDSSILELDLDSLRELPEQTSINNISYEALVPMSRSLLAIYEANGANVNPNPAVYQTDLRLHTLKALSFPTLEYRVTDATYLDEQGRFWAMNFFYPGDRYSLSPVFDTFATEKLSAYPLTPHGETPVERLVELQYTERGIVRTSVPPLYLEVLQGVPARNWEGLARLPERGFLVITDTYPRTIMGFIPHAKASQP